MIGLSPGVCFWGFNRPVTAAGQFPPNGTGLQVDHGGGFINPIDVVQSSPYDLECTYSDPVTYGDAWRTQPPFIGLDLEPDAGQSGLVEA